MTRFIHPVNCKRYLCTMDNNVEIVEIVEVDCNSNPTSKTKGNTIARTLGSNSVPNTSFIGKYGRTQNDSPLIEASDEPETDEGQTFTIPAGVRGQLGNPDLADVTNENFKIPTQPTMTSLQGDDRAPRVDVLWKVRDDESPESGTSISDCHLEFVKFKQESNILPLFNKTDLENQASRTTSEPNGNLQIVEMKSDEEEAAREKRGHHGDVRRFTNNIPLERRETFNWPWHSGNYRVTFHFQNPAFRTRFSSKMLLLKAIQWFLISCWTLGAKNIEAFKINAESLMWSLYVAMIVYIVTYLSARTTNMVESTPSSFIVMSIYTISLSHVTASLYIFYDYPLIPTTILSLSLSYLLMVLIFAGIKMDVQESTIFFPMCMSIFLFSVAAFWIVMVIRNENAGQTTLYIAEVWCPSLIIAQVIAAVEMSEIQSLIGGNRAPLGPSDWPIAATFLL